MIVLDTHIWVWWVQNDVKLTKQQQQWLQNYESDGLGISILSCWEVAKLSREKQTSFTFSYRSMARNCSSLSRSTTIKSISANNS